MSELHTKIKRITEKRAGFMTLEQFARELGISIESGTVWTYKAGTRVPSAETLAEVLRSPRSTQNAKRWARECLAVVLPGVKVTVTEPEQAS